MNFYEVSVDHWRVRIRAGSFSAAASRGLNRLRKECRLSSKKRNTVNVHIKVIARNVKRSDKMPDFEKE
jgi:hypothetical protein